MNKLKMLLVPSIILVFLTGCFAIPIGDGKKVKLSKSGITVIDEDGKEASLTVDTDEGSIHFSGPGNEEVSFGLNVDLPEDFPEEIPIAKDANIYTATSDVDAMIVLYGTKVPFEEILQSYEDFFDSYGFDSVDKEEIPTGEGNNRIVFQGQKEEEMFMIAITSLENEEENQIQIQKYNDPYYEPSENED